MKTEIKDLMPQWSLTKQDRNLTLTNDMDSLLLSNLLKDLFGYEINHFYSFSHFSTLDQSDKRLSIGCDLALKSGYTFCNHLVMQHSNSYKNPDSVNLNNVLNISNDQYSMKYNLSSLVTAWSLYDLPLPETEEGKMLLLSIDSAYMGYRNPKYQYIMVNWLERLGMTELLDLLNKYSQSDFKKFMLEHGLHTGIQLDDNGHLAFTKPEGLDLNWISEHLGFPVELPEGQFTTVGALSSGQIDGSQFNQNVLDNTFSMAFTYKNKISLSTFRRGESA